MAEFSLGTAALGTAIDLAGLRHGQDQAHKETQGWLSGLQGAATKGFGGLQKAVGAGLLGGLGLVTAGFTGLAVAFSDSVDLARIQEDAEKQLAAVLASTGEAAGLTAAEVKGMAKELQGVTNFGDEAILTGQNLLLTFTGIGEDVFPRATETMLDMATALGTDAKGSAIQLGKALNDPIAGISALSRVGVSFTEQQKEQIKALQESGDLMGAQTIILDELAKEFGGSARALVDPADQMKNAWNGLKETVGAGLLPIIENLYSKAIPLINTAIGVATEVIAGLTTGGWGLSEVMGTISEAFGFGAEKGTALADTITGIIAQVKAIKDAIVAFLAPIADAIGQFVSWKDILIALGIVVASVLWGIVVAAAPIIAVAAALVAAVALVRHGWETDFGGMRTIIEGAWAVISESFRGLMDGSLTLGEALGNVFSGILDLVKAKLPDWIATLKEWGTTIWQWIVDAIPPVLEKLREWGAAILQWVKDALPGWVATLKEWGTIIWQWIVDAIPPMLSRISEWASSLIRWLAGKLPDFLETIYKWATAIVVWIGEAIPKAIDSLTSFVENLGKTGDSTGGSVLGETVAKWVGLLIDWIKDDLIPKVGPAILTFAGSLLLALGKIAISLINLGGTLAGALVDGILAGINAGARMIADAVLNAARAAWEAAKNFLGIHSPSTLFADMGKQTMAGMAGGIRNNAALPLDAVLSAMYQTSRAGDVLGGSLAMRNLVGAAAGGASATVNQSFYGTADPQLVGRSSRQGVVEAMRRTGRG